MLERIKGIFAKTPTPPRGELASTEMLMYQALNIAQYNPDTLAQRKGGLKVYDAMRIDDMVKASLTLKKQATLAPGWEIEPTSEDAIDVEVAEFVKFAFGDMEGTTNNALKQILTALDYGYSVTELVWKIIDGGQYNGKIGLRALKPKRPHYYKFDLDKFSNIKPMGLIQDLGFGMGVGGKKLPINKFVIYSYQKEFGNWYGMSDLRPAYRNYWSKDNLIKFWNIYLERFGSPLIIGRYKGMSPQEVTDFRTSLDNIQSKTSITMPDTGTSEISMLEATRKGGKAEYNDAIDFHNRGIARAILIPDRISETGKTGAYSQAKVQFDTFLWVISQLRLELEDAVIGEQIIRRLVAFNYPGVTELPKFKFNPLTDEQRQNLVALFTEAVQRGATTPTLNDENHIRTALNFPEKTEEDVAEEERRRKDAMPDIDGGGEVKPDETKKVKPDKDEEKEDKKELAYAEVNLTTYEKRVDFKGIEDSLDRKEALALKTLRFILTKQRDALTAFVQTKYVNEKLTTSLINTGIDLKYVGELRSAVRTMFKLNYNIGASDGQAELPKKFVTAHQGIAVPPEKALAYFEAKANFVVAGITGPLTTETQGILLNALRTGAAIPVTIKALQDAYRPYLEDGTVLIDGKQLKGYRLEAIVRTNMSEAYAYGRRATADATAGYVVGYQFSEILDDRTVEVSKFVHGKIISTNHPSLDALTYPLHWNERGMFVYVTKDDGEVNFMGDGEIAQALSMKGI